MRPLFRGNPQKDKVWFMEIKMDPKKKQVLDDVFDAFSMLAGANYVALMHIDGGYSRYSPALADLMGLPGEYVEYRVMPWEGFVHPEDRKRYRDTVASLLSEGGRGYDITYRFRLKNGNYTNGRFIGSVIRDGSDKPVLIGGIIVNQGLMEKTDPVTVLRNKYGLFEDLAALMREDFPAVILLAGVSKLSKLNRLYGYTYGNRVLQEIAFLMQETVGSRGSVYRMDNATFAVLSESLSKDRMAAIYDTLRLKMQRGITIDGIRTILTANGGLISTDNLRMDPAAVYSCLSYAYRESKQRRNGELVDFNGAIDYDLRESLEMINTIRDCIVDGCKGFHVDYQPVISAKTERLIGLEALIRWRGEPYGEVEPLRFVPILEKDFVFEELSEWILRRVLADGRRFLEKDPRLTLSINVSAAQLEDEYFIDSVVQILEETDFPARNLCVEATKSCRMLEPERLKAIVNALHSRGIQVIIDDFGSGFESINFLKKLSADCIKFDRELVEGIENSLEDCQTVEYLARMAAARGTRVCVKGVETENMRDILKHFDVNSLQGNLYSKPEPFGVIMKRFLS